jgi:2',3'-cyclic-nucleotide 2'-phosphodiesterase (5'-nucleotidase family)
MRGRRPPLLLAWLLALAPVVACSRAPRRDLPDASPRVIARAPIPPVVAPPPPPPPAPPARPHLALFYSSDLRGRVSAVASPKARVLPPGVTLTLLAPRETTAGLARRASVVDRGRLDADAVIQVDAGDFLPLASDEPRDAAAPGPKDVPRLEDIVLNAYRRLGVDAVTLGERELAAGVDPRRQAARFAKARLPVVLANLTGRKGVPVFPADKIVDAGKLKVGIFGVAELGEAETAALAKAGYTLTNAAAAARTAAQGLRARGATFVVALVHAARGRARAAELVAGLDVDVTVASLGHDDAGAAAPDARPRVVAAGGATTVGRIELRAKDGKDTLTDTVLPLDEKVPEQLGVGLLTRVATIPMMDSDKMMAAMKRKGSKVRMADLYENWDYGSTKACGYCHEKAVAQWQTTEHATAYATLKKGKRERDTACLGCHVMGFLQPGGTRDWMMIATGFADVGCEACHGPSAEHVRSADKKLGTSRKVDPIICLGCHTPDQNLGTFDPVAATKEILGPGHGAPP